MKIPKNERKTIIGVIVLLLALDGVYYLYAKNQAKAPSENIPALTNQEQQQPAPASNQPTTAPTGKLNTINNTSTPDYTPKQFSSGEGESAGSDIQVWEVDFDGNVFTPGTINIKANDYVIFRNKSSMDLWVASNPHPTHTDYPEFDSKKNIPAGGKFQFQFTQAGSWGYHDHLNPSLTGTVVVAK